MHGQADKVPWREMCQQSLTSKEQKSRALLQDRIPLATAEVVYTLTRLWRDDNFLYTYLIASSILPPQCPVHFEVIFG